jgi:hypothetical protein
MPRHDSACPLVSPPGGISSAAARLVTTVKHGSVSLGPTRPTRANKPDGYVLGSYRIATAPERNSSRLTSLKSICFESPANNVGPWPAGLGCNELVLIDQSQLCQRQRKPYASHEQSFTRLCYL